MSNTFQSTLPARGATILTRQRVTPPNAFQSTLPARGATQFRPGSLLAQKISIHAPRTGSDTRPRCATAYR